MHRRTHVQQQAEAFNESALEISRCLFETCGLEEGKVNHLHSRFFACVSVDGSFFSVCPFRFPSAVPRFPLCLSPSLGKSTPYSMSSLRTAIQPSQLQCNLTGVANNPLFWPSLYVRYSAFPAAFLRRCFALRESRSMYGFQLCSYNCERHQKCKSEKSI